MGDNRSTILVIGVGPIGIKEVENKKRDISIENFDELYNCAIDSERFR